MKRFEELYNLFKEWLENQNSSTLHSSEIAYVLKHLYWKDKELFFTFLKQIDKKYLGDIILELPEKYRAEAIEFLSPEELATAVNKLESDDATDLIQDIEYTDETKSKAVFSKLDKDERVEISRLRQYEKNQAGAWMQTEFFYGLLDETVGDSIKRLKEQKKSNELHEIYQVFVVDKNQKIISTLRVDDILVLDFELSYREVIDLLGKKLVSVYATDDIGEVSQIFEKYNLQVIPVVDWQGKIIGRITSDDMYDIISEIATEQIYNMAGVDDEVEQQDAELKDVIKKRGSWLLINLFTAILASLVIGLFDETLQALIPLAILMPIVASMGGNAGTQTLTVMVRQIALGEIEKENARSSIFKEVKISIINGLFFALVIGGITLLWFPSAPSLLPVVIAISMIINIFIAGFFGATIPLFLKQIQVDPAVGSSVLLTTATDIFGFLSFLGLAKIMLGL
jgi:magnesium transporter